MGQATQQPGKQSKEASTGQIKKCHDKYIEPKWTLSGAQEGSTAGKRGLTVATGASLTAAAGVVEGESGTRRRHGPHSHSSNRRGIDPGLEGEERHHGGPLHRPSAEAGASDRALLE